MQITGEEFEKVLREPRVIRHGVGADFGRDDVYVVLTQRINDGRLSPVDEMRGDLKDLG